MTRRELGGLVRISEAGELLDRLPRSALSESDSLGDLGLNFSFDASQIIGMDHVVGFEPTFESHDRLLMPPSLDLGLVAIELGIEHRMRAQAIGAAFQEIGLAALAHRVDGTTRRGFDRNHVHAVDSL